MEKKIDIHELTRIYLTSSLSKELRYISVYSSAYIPMKMVCAQGAHATMVQYGAIVVPSAIYSTLFNPLGEQ